MTYVVKTLRIIFQSLESEINDNFFGIVIKGKLIETLENERLQLLKLHVYEIDTVLRSVFTQFVQVHLIGFDGIGRITSFQSQPGMVLAQQGGVGCHLFCHGSSPWKAHSYGTALPAASV